MIDRRRFLRSLIHSLPVFTLGPSLLTHAQQASPNVRDLAVGTLQAADKNGIRLPIGYQSRIVAVSGQPVAETGYIWHHSPDGGACFARPDGGWIYVSNCEEWSPLRAGVSAIEFDKTGKIIKAQRVLSGTFFNCSGGPTPWGTWLSCEEMDCGSVYECDPTGQMPAVEHPALGYFQHEALAYDTEENRLYLTEDEKDGCLYRFTPSRFNHRSPAESLKEGLLEVALWDGHHLTWQAVPNPTPSYIQTRTRYQVKGAQAFAGAEGIWYHNKKVWFTTKRDNRVWEIDIPQQTLRVIYDAALTENPILKGVDAITASQNGQILVAEDEDDMQLVTLDRSGNAVPFLQVIDQPESEITGPAFSPNGQRLYFSSQRGLSESQRLGITYEITRK